jgi:hypothetical protein
MEQLSFMLNMKADFIWRQSMSCRIMIRFLSLNFIFLVLLGAPAFSQDTPHIIWTENDAGRHSLKMRSKIGSQWSKSVVKIEESQNPIIGPTATMNARGDTWVAWTELSGMNGRLQYRIQRGGRWGAAAEVPTQTTSDMAPSMIVDPQGIPWMVWSGTDETDDDIYFSRWIGSQWQKPERVNEDDGWPDILPSIELDSQNRVRVSWQGYNGDRYVQYAAYWNGQGWSREEVIRMGIVEPQKSTAPPLPDFIPPESQGCLIYGKSQAARRFRKNAGGID